MKPKVGIILGTARPTRFSEKAAQWLANIAKQRNDAEFEVVDLGDYPMPFFEKERSPMSAPPKSAIALLWGKSVTPMLEIWCRQMSSRPGVNRQRIRSPFKSDRSLSPTLRPLMRWFVLQ
ncbi:MAG: hypothetical protein QOD25_647 [Alphaproteobacteria bacterium]|nr:hypothetical protein [Alphaproteobacteria bacterium]